MKRHKIRQTDQRSVQACVEQLQALIDGLKAGNIGMRDADEPVLLRPSEVVDFELRVDQTPRKETLRVEMSWRPEPEPLRAAAGTDPAPPAPAEELPAAPPGVPSTTTHFAPELLDARQSPGVETDSPLSTHTLDRMATAEYQRLFAAARILGSDGQWHIDHDQLIVSLASVGVDPLTQQELYALALQADADGRASLLSERLIEAIKRVSQHPPPPDAEPGARAATGSVQSVPDDSNGSRAQA
jgi:amphi-Trp domain-containing protein